MYRRLRGAVHSFCHYLVSTRPLGRKEFVSELLVVSPLPPIFTLLPAALRVWCGTTGEGEDISF